MHIKHFCRLLLTLPFVSEAVGIIGGALVGLVIYTAYKQVVGTVHAMLPAPVETAEDTYRRIGERAQGILVRLRDQK